MNLEKIIKTRLYKKIVVFFHQNPSSIDTARGVSAWVNSDKAKVSKALNHLVKSKILNIHKSPNTFGYSYTNDKKISKKIEEIIGKM